MRQPSRVGGRLLPAWRGKRARQARVLRLLPTESERGVSLACAHTRKQAGRARSQGRRAAPRRPCSERERTLLLCGDLLESEGDSFRRSNAHGCGKRACCASSPQKASAVDALLHTCASRPRGAQGRRVTYRSLAPNERALSLSWRPSRVRGRIPTCAARCAHVASARAAPAPRRERARWLARVCAYAQTRWPRASPRPARGTTALHRTREGSSLVQRPSRSRGPISTRAAWRARAASACAASPPNRVRAQWRACVCEYSQRANLPKVRCPPLAAPASFAPTKQTKRKPSGVPFLCCGSRGSGGAAIKFKRERLAFPP